MAKNYVQEGMVVPFTAGANITLTPEKKDRGGDRPTDKKRRWDDRFVIRVVKAGSSNGFSETRPKVYPGEFFKKKG